MKSFNEISEIVKRLNHVIFFIVSIIVIIIFVVEAIEKYWMSSNNQIKIVDNSKLKSKEKIKEHISVGNVYHKKNHMIFDIYKSQIDKNKVAFKSYSSNQEQFKGHGFNPTAHSPSGENINFLIYNTKSNNKWLLFKSDVLILEKYIPLGAYNKIKLNGNLFKIIVKDTNKNGMFDSNDKNTLVYVNNSWKKIIKIKDNCINYNIHSANELLVQAFENKVITFYLFNTLNYKLKRIMDLNQLYKKK